MSLATVSPTATDLILVALCLMSSAFFSGSETALTALGTAKTRQILEASGGRHSLRLWLRQPERVLATLLIGNTLVNIAASALVTDFASRLGLPHAVAFATGVTTLVVLTFGEVTPKTFAKANAEKVARLVMPLVAILFAALWPFAVSLVWVARTSVRIFGGEVRATGPAVTSEEIEYLIGLGSKEGVLDKVKQELLTSVLDFVDMVVKDSMLPRIRMTTIDKDSPFNAVMHVVTECGHSRIPVYDGTVDNVVGILYAKDLIGDLCEKGSPPPEFSLSKYLRPAFFVPESMKISRLLREFQRRRVHMAIVVDEFGGTSGLVTMEDVVEEIVGEIQDEHDAEEKSIKPISAGVYLVDASASLRELGPQLGVEFPEDAGYETLGGFLTATAGKVPPPGSVLVWKDLTFTVRASDERRVSKAEVATKRPEGQASPSGEPARVIPMPKAG